ncbi:E3 ubiquitin-protein ligase RNF19A-like isoform X1 [Denticeps clupeoides]|nr:E3 ubiquitin-protein ligase RNF19A-like isoform X1 [Denticeps clupeoides]
MQQLSGGYYEPPLKFVNRPDDITLDNDPDTMRVEMSCGHAVTSESLTQWCRSVLEQGQYKFTCPAIKDNTTVKCNAAWPYEEVRRVALLTDEEQVNFEETIARIAASEYFEYKSCPGCRSFIMRKDMSNMCVHCTICSAEKGKTFYFCWQCLRKWKGPAPRSDHCNNEGCINPDVQRLKNCISVTLTQVENVVCPSMRACPTCGRLVEHSGQACKNMRCMRCQVEFCFICLKTKSVCSKTSWPYKACPGGVAPPQEAIPVWKK